MQLNIGIRETKENQITSSYRGEKSNFRLRCYTMEIHIVQF